MFRLNLRWLRGNSDEVEAELSYLFTGAEYMKEEKRGKGIKFERIRRITGYLVGTMEKWNDAKKAEERDRVKHM